MTNECPYFNNCEKADEYRNGLEDINKRELQYFLTVCLDGGDLDCIKRQKSLDKRVINQESDIINF